MNYITDQVVSKLLESAKKKNKGGMDLKPFHIKGHLWMFINCLVENPSFDSQTKETLTLKAKSFGSTCTLSDKFIKQVCVGVMVDSIRSSVLHVHVHVGSSQSSTVTVHVHLYLYILLVAYTHAGMHKGKLNT